MNETSDMLEFKTREDFRIWLQDNNEKSNGIWILFTKGCKSFSANDALEEALCFGWIDGLIKSVDEKTYKKYFSKRKDTENWSGKNKALYEKLLAAGLMTDAGIAAFKAKHENAGKAADINEKIVQLRHDLQDTNEILCLFDSKAPSRQKQLAGFYTEAKTAETRYKRKTKIIDALLNDYKGMLY